MKLERISDNKIKFSIGVEELEQKGLFEQDQWKDSYIWHDLFEEMLDEVQGKFGIETQMEITVEIESFDEKEICMILTLESDEEFFDWEHDVESISPQKELDILIQFSEFDPVVELLKRLSHSLNIKDDSISIELYSYDGHYYLLFEDLIEKDFLLIDPFSFEYGDKPRNTKYVLKEYGHPILIKNTLSQILLYF
ncbi:adaptor protein MecA [Rossellomorea aquimaris]|uniref:adaptor protein MecA n=1 Tax=Rossellomorea aquimaris TaxID=189382 RepID=UPI0007D046A9|nr:adaptor protein MecA [Rossellomorea aquimaris]